jgi:hypothetical protein
VHRDIKPENILLQEGEAMLADFGIALAVKEAGGHRLTQTGLSLGTPQSMSPEQATGDRTIDARSDVYSLAAVLYEMLAGEPPVTGASAQSMIAKLMTESPTRLRVLRSTVPAEVDEAVAKALSKTPADRFATAGDFVRALVAKPETAPQIGTAGTPSRRHRGTMIGLAAAGIVAAAIGAWALRSRAPGHASLGTKTQLTSTGGVYYPAISSDGKQLAFLTRQCAGASCTYDAVVQDVGGTQTRTLLHGATASYGLEWSPDRRNLLFAGTVGGRSGTYLLSALGGEPRWLTGGVATFYAGGDSLLLASPLRRDSVFWMRVAALDGVARDSIRVAGPGSGLAALSVVPGTNWILTLVPQPPHGLWQMIDRSGKVADHVVNACTCGGIAATDAVWLARAGDGLEESVVRIAIDRSNGHFSARQDTMTRAVFTAFSVTGDGQSMVMDEGTFDNAVWAVPLADALKGALPDDRRILRASSEVGATVSPDGERLLVGRLVALPGGHSELRFSVMPFDGGAETPLSARGTVRRARWSDESHVAIGALVPGGLRLSELDVQSGAERNVLQLSDSALRDLDALPDGWVWIAPTRDRLVVARHGARREYRAPAGFGGIYQLDVDRARRRVLYVGYGGATGDSTAVVSLSLDDGKQTLLMTTSGEFGRVTASTTHAAVVGMARTQDSWELLAIDAPGQVTSLGTIGRPIASLSVSDDLRRATVMVRDYRADAWLNRVAVH